MRKSSLFFFFSVFLFCHAVLADSFTAAVNSSVSIPVATFTNLGIVKPDNATTFVDSNGVISAVGGGGSNSIVAGQSTQPRAVGTNTAIDVVGTLTNSTTGNAATATSATSATYAPDSFIISSLFQLAAGTNAVKGYVDGFTNQVTAVAVNAAVPGLHTNLPPSNGSNDTVMLQNAFTSNSLVFLYPNSIYYASNLYVTNSLFISGQGATIRMISGASSYLINSGTNNVLNQTIKDLTLDGQAALAYNTFAMPIPLNNFEISTNAPFTNRCAILVPCQNRFIGDNVHVKNFQGFGFAFRNWWGTESYKGTNCTLIGCDANNNLIGYYAGGFGFGLNQGYPYNPSSFAYDSAEYVNFVNCRSENNAYGFMTSAGNITLRALDILNCKFGVVTGGGPNGQHGSFDNLTINHCTYPFLISAGGDRFRGLNSLANSNPGLVMDGAQLVVESGSVIAGATPSIIVSNTTLSAQTSLLFIYNEMTGANITNMISVASSNCYAVFKDNIFLNGLYDQTVTNGGFGLITNTSSSPAGQTISYVFNSGGGGGSANAQPPSVTLSNLTDQVSTPLNLGGGTNLSAATVNAAVPGVTTTNYVNSIAAGLSPSPVISLNPIFWLDPSIIKTNDNSALQFVLDSSGNGNTASNGTTNSVIYLANGINGSPAISFPAPWPVTGGGLASAGYALTNNFWLPSMNTNVSITFVARDDLELGGPNSTPLIGGQKLILANAGTNAALILSLCNATASVPVGPADFEWGANLAYFNVQKKHAPVVCTLNIQNGFETVWLDGLIVWTTNIIGSPSYGTAGGSPFIIGNLNVNGNLRGDLGAFCGSIGDMVVTTNALNPNQIASLHKYEMQKYNVGGGVGIYLNGDSLTFGQYAGMGSNFLTVISQALPSTTVIDVSHPGFTANQLAIGLTNWAPNKIQNTSKSVAVIWQYANDAHTGNTLQAWTNTLISEASFLHAKNFTVLICTAPSLIWETNTPLTRPIANNWIYTNWTTYFDGLVDYASDPDMGYAGAWTNTLYFRPADQVHLIGTSYQLLSTRWLIPALQKACFAITPSVSGGSTNSLTNTLSQLLGDVTAGPGTNGPAVATVVQVGGLPASSVVSGANAANAATATPSANTIMKRDASGGSLDATNAALGIYNANASGYQTSAQVSTLISGSTNQLVRTNDTRALNLTNSANKFGGSFAGNAATASKVVFANSDGAIIAQSADGAHVFSWLDGASEFVFTDPIISPSFIGNGAAVTNLNATELRSGTVADARLSANAALLNGNQTFSGPNNLTNAGNNFSGTGTNLIGTTGNITSTGATITITPSKDAITGRTNFNADLPNKGTAGTYRSMTTDAQGRVTAGTAPTTFSGYAISDTSANLAAALTDETGSGAAVFGTSPTIVNGTYSGNVGGTTNYQSTNIVIQTGTLAASSASTNFTVNLLPGEHGNVQQVYLANTNAFITFTGTNITDSSRCVLFRGWTNTINSTLLFNLPAYHTNQVCSLTISNGMSAFFTFWNSDTSGSNVTCIDDGRTQ